MIVGIDASRAISDAPTGTETYSRELIRALLALDQKNFYRLYTRQAVERECFSMSRNFEIRAIPFPRLWTHWRLSLEMLAHPPDVLFVPAHVLPLAHPRRSVVTIHDLGDLYFPTAHPIDQRIYQSWSRRWNARKASHLFADSQATKDDLIKFYRVDPPKISVVYPAYDARLFKPVRDARVVEETMVRFRVDRDYILTIGTIHPRKNYIRLIEAFARLPTTNYQLLIVGKRGWHYHPIYKRVQELNLQSRIAFLDFVPASDLPALISGARLFAFPSLHEGFGLPILEAQACGTPVVCSNTSSLPEAAGEGALFFDPHDVNAIADAVQRALSGTVLRETLIARGFENVKRFSWEKSAQGVMGVLNAA